MNIPVAPFDDSIAKHIGRLPKSVSAPFHLLGHIARPSYWVIVLLCVALICQHFGQSTNLTYALICALFIPFSSLLKFIFRRQRPQTIYTQSMRITSYSFPSSHSYTSALATTALALILAGYVDSALALTLGLMLFAGAAIVGVSRVYVGAHYPSDVLGGLLLGVIVAVGLFIGVTA